MTRAVKLSATCALILLLSACAATQQQKLYQAGLTSKSIGETAYQGMFILYEGGELPAEVWQDTRKAYRTWKAAHDQYIFAARANAGIDDHFRYVSANTLAALVKIAAEWNAFEQVKE